MITTRVSLNESQFASLVRGEVIRVGNNEVSIEIALRDIGFEAMQRALNAAQISQRLNQR